MFPTLHTESLNLVETVAPAHLPGMYKMVTDERVRQFYNVVPVQQQQDLLQAVSRFKKAYDDQSGIRWAITLKGSNDYIGTVGFQAYARKHRGTLAYALIPNYWNKGYISEALKEVLKYGFEELGLNRIDAELRPGNIPSETVLKKQGFTHEGLLRQWTMWNGEYQDMNMYALLKADWLAASLNG